MEQLLNDVQRSAYDIGVSGVQSIFDGQYQLWQNGEHLRTTESFAIESFCVACDAIQIQMQTFSPAIFSKSWIPDRAKKLNGCSVSESLHVHRSPVPKPAHKWC